MPARVRLPLAASLLALLCGAAAADDVVFHATLNADLIGIMSGGRAQRGYELDMEDFTARANLGPLLGADGLTAYVDIQNTSGGQPNENAGTLQGIDSIEVSEQRLRLYEAYLEQEFSALEGSLRVGIYDITEEFNETDSSALLIGPSFGLGAELSEQYVNGPSTFPSTSLAARLYLRPTARSYVRFVVFDAQPGTLGDPGPKLGFHDGVAVMAEGGYFDDLTKIGIGVWRYAKRLEPIDPLPGDTDRHVAEGVYFLFDSPLAKGDATTVFVRAGLSDGQTTDFSASWQAGFRLPGLIDARPDGVVEIGAGQGLLSHGLRTRLAFAGTRPAWAETTFEITYADKLAKWLTVQPDLELVTAPGGLARADAVFLAGLRVTVTL